MPNIDEFGKRRHKKVVKKPQSASWKEKRVRRHTICKPVYNFPVKKKKKYFKPPSYLPIRIKGFEVNFNKNNFVNHYHVKEFRR